MYSFKTIILLILFSLLSLSWADNTRKSGPNRNQNDLKTVNSDIPLSKLDRVKKIAFQLNQKYKDQDKFDQNLSKSISGENDNTQRFEEPVKFYENENALAEGNICILSASTFGESVSQYLIASNRFTSVTVIDGLGISPSLNTLLAYDAVGVFGWSSWLNSEAIGDTLADFVDSGGNLLTAFAANANVGSGGWTVLGRFAEDNYWLISPNTYVGSTPFSMGTIFNAGHPIMEGVESFVANAKLDNTATVSEGAIILAEFTDGTPLVAYSETDFNGKRVDLSCPIITTEQSSWGLSLDTDGQALVINAFDWLANVVSTNVLVLSNNTGENNWMKENFEANISDINMTTMDVNLEVPDLDYLLSFDVVMLHESNFFSNSVNVGNRMYEFVLSGGNLIISTFYWQGRTDGGFDQSWGNLEMIDPLYGGSCDYAPGSLDIGSIIEHDLTMGLDTLFASQYRGGPATLRENATTVAWWEDGDPLITFNNPTGWITAVTLFPAHPLYDPVSGDFYQLWDNVIKWKSTEMLSGTIDVSPDSLSFTLIKGDSTSSVLNVSNIGSGGLMWSTNSNFLNTFATTEQQILNITSKLTGLEAPFYVEQQKSNDQKITPEIVNSIQSSASGKVLMLRDGETEKTAADILTVAGFDVTLSDTLEYAWDGTNPSPDGFSTIVLFDGPTYETPMNESGQTALVDFVEQGGGLVFTEWIVNDAQRHTTMADLIMLTRTGGADGTEMYSVIKSHPVVEGIAESFSVSTGTNVGMATSGTVLVTGSVAGDAVVVKEHELGRIVEFASAGNWDGYDPFAEANMQKLLVNAVSWAGAGWLSTDPDSGFIQAGNSQEINVFVNSKKLEYGNYSGQITIQSNDPLNPVIQVPVNLQVDSLATDIEILDQNLPLSFELFQNFPNPFNPETSIQYQISSNQHVSIILFDLLGKRVTTLVDKFQNAGRYNVVWNGKDMNGNNAASGVYIYKMTAGPYENNKKLVLLK